MSISSALTSIKNKIANAYTAVSYMGGDTPTQKTLANLPPAIKSITNGWIATCEDEVVQISSTISGTNVQTGAAFSEVFCKGSSYTIFQARLINNGENYNSIGNGEVLYACSFGGFLTDLAQNANFPSLNENTWNNSGFSFIVVKTSSGSEVRRYNGLLVSGRSYKVTRYANPFGNFPSEIERLYK